MAEKLIAAVGTTAVVAATVITLAIQKRRRGY